MSKNSVVKVVSFFHLMFEHVRQFGGLMLGVFFLTNLFSSYPVCISFILLSMVFSSFVLTLAIKNEESKNV